MYSYLKGMLVQSGETLSGETPYVIVEVQGVGYQVLTSQQTLHQLPPMQSPMLVYTSLVVREDAMQLVGFFSKEERELFEMLLGASGVGLKNALSLLSTLPIAELSAAIMGADHKRLSAAKGIGPKLAQKIALELKEKMTRWRESRLSQLGPVSQAQKPALFSTAFEEAETVLLSLGYQIEEIYQSLHHLQTQEPEAGNLSSEEVLQRSLKWLATHLVG